MLASRERTRELSSALHESWKKLKHGVAVLGDLHAIASPVGAELEVVLHRKVREH
jgi:hypothetical protein